MRRTCAVLGAVAMMLALAQPALAAEKCPPEVAQAKARLQQAAAQKTRTAKSQEVQAPRALAGAKGQEVQAPRGQEVQAPRAQEVQAPRGQEVQAPRAQEVQAPRSLTKARTLVREAEAACKKGNMALASSKAKEAMDLLK